MYFLLLLLLLDNIDEWDFICAKYYIKVILVWCLFIAKDVDYLFCIIPILVGMPCYEQYFSSMDLALFH